MKIHSMKDLVIFQAVNAVQNMVSEKLKYTKIPLPCCVGRPMVPSQESLLPFSLEQLDIVE